MNVISLAHKLVQNQQQKTSWNDDPFDLKGMFDGMSNNKSITITDFAENLASQYAKYTNDQYELTLDMLPEDEQNEFAQIYIESIDRDIEWACYGEDQSINSDFLCALLAMLKDDCTETRQNFAEVTRKNILTYYAETLNQLLITACDTYLNNAMNEQGYYIKQDVTHGDMLWEKL